MIRTPCFRMEGISATYYVYVRNQCG
jgi:hypothetical protein